MKIQLKPKFVTWSSENESYSVIKLMLVCVGLNNDYLFKMVNFICVKNGGEQSLSQTIPA